MEEKTAFLKAFVRLAKADGALDEEELNFIRGVASLYGLDESHKDEILAADTDEHIIEAVKGIKNRRAALELIKEMCMLAHADDVLSDDETLFIGKVGQAMGVDLDKIEQISKWVIDRIIWLEEGKIIFEEV
jgi:uncharacterized tellurite resistance protein B-like protein